MTDPRRVIPSVDTLLAAPSFGILVEQHGRGRVSEGIRRVQEAVRADPPDPVPAAAGWYAERVRVQLERSARPSLRRVINATGVVLHTNLGRAPLAEAAMRAMAEVAGYATLEYDVEVGGRGSRHDHCAGLLRELTGAESAVVVNNNAAAVVLVLDTLARGRPAVISRGELVEIGGSFRVPEIMARSGAIMREVGSTNRTHVADYRDALRGVDPEGPAGADGSEEAAGLVLKVHRSNFRVEGFTAEVEAAELAGVTRAAGVPLVHDLGSGALVDLTEIGLPAETTAREALEAGADVVTLSGDKLLGGPQAGIILGRADLVERIRFNPLCRAVRCDKMTLAALEATLALYRDGRAFSEIPVLRMLAATPESLRKRADGIASRLRSEGLIAEVVPASGAVGGGAYPGVELRGSAVAVAGVAGGTGEDEGTAEADGPGSGSPDALAEALRRGDPPVIGRIHEGRLLLDPRTISKEDKTALVAVVVAATSSLRAGRQS